MLCCPSTSWLMMRTQSNSAEMAIGEFRSSSIAARQRFSSSEGSIVDVSAGLTFPSASTPFIRRSSPFSAACRASFEKSSVERYCACNTKKRMVIGE